MSHFKKVAKVNSKDILSLVQSVIPEINLKKTGTESYSFRGFKTSTGDIEFAPTAGHFNRISNPEVWNHWRPGFEDRRLLDIVKDYFDVNKITRIRLIRMMPFACYSWHKDITLRIHIPLITNDETFMVIDKEIFHLDIDSIYIANTLEPHTAFNGGKVDRYHLIYDYHGEWNEFT